MKKLVIATLMAGLWIGAPGPASGMGSTQARPTLLVMPARYTTMQLAFDLIAKRDMVLVGYQDESGGTVVLHVCGMDRNGSRSQWTHIGSLHFSALRPVESSL